MNNVKFTKIEKQSFTVKEMRAFGFSMLDGIRGDIVDCETGKLPEMKLAGNYTDDAIESCTERARIGNHIDVMCPTAEIAFDIGREMKVEKGSVKKLIITSMTPPTIHWESSSFTLPITATTFLTAKTRLRTSAVRTAGSTVIVTMPIGCIMLTAASDTSALRSLTQTPQTTLSVSVTSVFTIMTIHIALVIFWIIIPRMFL